MLTRDKDIVWRESFITQEWLYIATSNTAADILETISLSIRIRDILRQCQCRVYGPQAPAVGHRACKGPKTSEIIFFWIIKTLKLFLIKKRKTSAFITVLHYREAVREILLRGHKITGPCMLCNKQIMRSL